MARETRDRILRTATSHFVAPDARRPSLRAIARAAHVNSALIHYHFGGREGLLEAVVLRALAPIQARRLACLEEIRSAGSADGDDLARLCIAPLGAAEPRAPGPEEHALDAESAATSALQLLARASIDDGAQLEALTIRHFAPSLYALRDVLHAALPALDPPQKHLRFRIAAQAGLEAMAGPARIAARRAGEEPVYLEALHALLAGGLEAKPR